MIMSITIDVQLRQTFLDGFFNKANGNIIEHSVWKLLQKVSSLNIVLFQESNGAFFISFEIKLLFL